VRGRHDTSQRDERHLRLGHLDRALGGHGCRDLLRHLRPDEDGHAPNGHAHCRGGRAAVAVALSAAPFGLADAVLLADALCIADALRLAEAGADSLLIGETLMRSQNILADLPQFRAPTVERLG